MLAFLKNFFGGQSPDYAVLVKNGAIIVDVRTKDEYKAGHIAGSLNIPVNELGSHLAKLPQSKTIITCCASGMRSASAKAILRSNGYENVHNGGSWSGLQRQL